MSKNPKDIDPLGPLDAVTRVLVGVVIVFTLLGIGAVASGQGSWMGINAESICRTPNFGVGDGDSANETALFRDDFGLTSGVSIEHFGTEICQARPSVGQSVLSGMSDAPTFLVFIGFLFLTRRTIKYARRNGLFSTALAERIEALGWLLLLGLIGSAVIEWLADGLLKHSMASTMSWHSGSFSVSLVGIISAYGIITVGRVMSRAAVMHSDLEGTV